VVGAGDAGEAVAREFQRRPQDGIVPIGFVDDDPLKRRIRIHGLPVLGTTRDIPELVSRHDADIILVAMTNASGETLRDIVARCEQTTARLCILPSVAELVDGQSGRSPIRDINIEDLLRRDPVRTDMGEIARYITGQRVLVTGAGGSIGSELCRQIATLNPARLLLVGHGENSIFEIEQELIREYGFAPTALIGDVKDYQRIEEIFLQERPTVVFHAAAHKHVPLMEANPQEAVKNNVLGTRNVATIAAQCGVRKFILVSSDKAVHPVSVMGATKRIGEMLIQSMATTTGGTEFAAVRFGNVLGSRGSVIPVLRKQIAAGGPVTVTDPLMTRYFMTIPESVQLILQAGALGTSGDIFILDMGEPVRILDLTRDLIRLSGFRPDIDIKIQFTGIRPGEKLHEELVYDSEGKERAHEKIFVARCPGIDRVSLMREVDRLIRLAEDGERPERLREEIIRVAQGNFTPLPEDKRPKEKPVIEGVPLT
jgi:FlaA1/EpsC-like NDP-sugar epimerase